MPLHERPVSRRTARSMRLALIAPPSLRSVAILAVFALAMAGCSSPGASSAWSYGPSLAPAASGSAAPSAAAPSAAAPPSVVPSAPASPVASAGSAAPSGAVTKLTIGTKTGAELGFDPDDVKVPTGTTVSITFENRSTLPHNLTFKAPIDAATDAVVAPGASATIEFTAPAPGDYAWACTIHPGMQGKLEVEAAN
jgi:plastocyanin